MTRDYFSLIRQWAEDRNLINGSTPEKQFVKLIEEIGEIAHGMSKGRIEEIKDGIGDAVVVLTIIAAQHRYSITEYEASEYDKELDADDRFALLVDSISDVGMRCTPARIDYALGDLGVLADKFNLTLEECIAAAWEEIKDRKGKMVNGVFVKEADL